MTLLSEISGVRERARAAEDRAIAILEETDQLRAREAELAAAIARAREASEGERVQLDERDRELADEVAVRTDRRTILSGRVGDELRRAYESILRRGRLPALVPRRGRACGRCFGTLPLQAASEIRRQERPYTCEHCGASFAPPANDGTEIFE